MLSAPDPLVGTSDLACRWLLDNASWSVVRISAQRKQVLI